MTWHGDRNGWQHQATTHRWCKRWCINRQRKYSSVNSIAVPEGSWVDRSKASLTSWILHVIEFNCKLCVRWHSDSNYHCVRQLRKQSTLSPWLKPANDAEVQSPPTPLITAWMLTRLKILVASPDYHLVKDVFIGTVECKNTCHLKSNQAIGGECSGVKAHPIH